MISKEGTGVWQGRVEGNRGGGRDNTEGKRE